eukprot:TRINITY_DN4862_c0_g1_i5.p1 TRINITY_DN4862_c0_g1~~TRINITY_DN4862_c0_g1_i5.p1  ORF type:complete len:516 (-),score=105.42 TRINITY_DN4862_c0_g1_i5:51-1598(-)
MSLFRSLSWFLFVSLFSFLVGSSLADYQSDDILLRELYTATQGSLWHDPWQIDTQPDHCRWMGVNCNVLWRTIDSINLSGRNLQGTLPDSLANAGIPHIDLSYNQLTGTVPALMIFSVSIQTLYLDHNKLSGIINVTNMFTAVSSIHLNNNDFVGTLPSSLFSLSFLNDLDLSSNHFVGTLPSVMLSPFIHLSISDNDLSGPLPIALCTSSRLITLHAERNNFTGNIPTCLNNMGNRNKSQIFIDDQQSPFCGHLPSFCNLPSHHCGAAPSSECPNVWLQLVDAIIGSIVLDIIKITETIFINTVDALLDIARIRLPTNFGDLFDPLLRPTLQLHADAVTDDIIQRLGTSFSPLWKNYTHSTVINITVWNGGKLVPVQNTNIEIGFRVDESVANSIDNLCLGYIDEVDFRWKCQSRLTLVGDDYAVGTTSHLTSFAIITDPRNMPLTTPTSTAASSSSPSDYAPGISLYGVVFGVIGGVLAGVVIAVVGVLAYQGKFSRKGKHMQERELDVESTL